MVPFEQGVASVKVPGRASPVALMGAWIGEGSAKPVFAASLTTTTLTPGKLSAVSTFTEEMMAASSIEMLVRETLAHDLAAFCLIPQILRCDGGKRGSSRFNGATVVTKIPEPRHSMRRC